METPKLSQWRSYWGGKGGRVPPLTAKICQKSGKNQEKLGKKEEKSGRKGKNREVSFTLPLLTDKAGYATELSTWKGCSQRVTDRAGCPMDTQNWENLKVVLKLALCRCYLPFDFNRLSPEREELRHNREIFWY